MKRLIATCTSPRLQVWIAGIALVTWTILWPITMGSHLATSISWLTNASLFANVATCFGWWVTALVQLRAERIEANSSEAATLAHVEALELQIAELLTAAGISEINHHVAAICDHLGIVSEPSIP